MKKKKLIQQIIQLYDAIDTLIYNPESKEATEIKTVAENRRIRHEVRKDARELIKMQREANKSVWEKLQLGEITTSEYLKAYGLPINLEPSDNQPSS